MPPNDYEHFMTGNFDVTNALYLLQHSILQQKWKLSLEDHVHCAMATNYILLLTPNVFPDELLPFFNKDNLSAIIDKIESTYDIKKYYIPTRIFTSIINIVQDLNIGTINRRKAISQLLELDFPANEHKFVQGIIGLIQKILCVTIAEDVNKSELGTRYIDPFLCGLFDGPDQGMFLRWTNEMTLEAKRNENFGTKRPDICITSLHGVQWKANHGFGEVKSFHQGDKSNFLLCADLVRVGIFCRNACALQNMDGVLGLHIVGRTVLFYVLLSPSAHLYVMYELAKIKISNCIDDLTKLVVDMHHILRVLDVFHRICIRSANPSLPIQYQMTITTSNHDHVISSSQNRKRACHLKYHHN
ncbi:hypothetical protein G6F56_000698 [Rhizopus delemar]|uniref:Uncharacterized protein n=1 Tax=Rhizopus stolonifer TaxID=4846 RepID=A0A367IN02_RHIST|nr:hypothetical protein G6F56_000698 [Rhizopus delemar]RCH79048.1 hypothetical protein CU098_005139 [Rhizopus stolonifer]